MLESGAAASELKWVQRCRCDWARRRDSGRHSLSWRKCCGFAGVQRLAICWERLAKMAGTDAQGGSKLQQVCRNGIDGVFIAT